MAPAAAGAGTARLFQAGVGYLYAYQATILLNEAPGANIGNDVGFQISSDLSVSTVWDNPDNPNQKLIQLEIIKPTLLIKSRKAPSPDGFVYHSSQLDGAKNGQFFILWENGRVEKIYLDPDEDTSISNLKKGIASLLQFQIIDQELQETDASGKCKTNYKSIDEKTILKIKSKCTSDLLTPKVHPEQVWGTNVNSRRQSLIEMSSDLSKVQSISSDESHEMRLSVRREVGSSVISRQHVTLTDKQVNVVKENGASVEEILKKVEQRLKIKYELQQLTLTKESLPCNDCPTFYKAVQDNREFLNSEYLGTSKSAAAFVRLLPFAREARREEIHKVLKSPKNKDILPQLLDLIGSAQTPDAHKAAMKYLHFGAESDLDINERYLWALSFGSHPVKDVLTDVNNLLDQQLPSKLLQTSILTLAAVLNKYRKLTGKKDTQVIENIQSKFIKYLSDCSETDDDCKIVILRALQNLQLEDSVPILVSHALSGSKKVSVRAMKTLRAMPSSMWNEEVLKAAELIYFQTSGKYDSSARTLALDILLESKPSTPKLKLLLSSLARDEDSAYEVKQYMIQRLNQLSYSDKDFEEHIKYVIQSLKFNNYHNLALKGLSTAFTRLFMNNPSANGSLSTVQEMSNGIVKQGNVDIILEQFGQPNIIFTLGLFAGGLGSFVSSDEETTAEDADEVATAGMELSVLGVQIRPFVFFSGQGELMGHVWSGTGSERTPAFQVLSPLQDHKQSIPLESGFIADLSTIGGVSFDLSGQIQMSLWNRNAQSLVEKNAGISVRGLLNVDSMFVRSQVEFTLSTEVKLNLISNIDFYNTIALCLQLRQPDSVLKHNIFKIERIPGSKHRLRKSKYKVLALPGKTYALNQKNNEMCNIIFRVEYSAGQ